MRMEGWWRIMNDPWTVAFIIAFAAWAEVAIDRRDLRKRLEVAEREQRYHATVANILGKQL